MEKILSHQLKNGKFSEVPIKRSQMMGAIKSKGNKTTEIKFCQGLGDANIIGWERQIKIFGNPDIVFPLYNLAIFLDGCFWHGCPKCGHVPKTNYNYWYMKILRNKERDLQRKLALEKKGYTVLRFWEHELNHNLQECINVTKEAIEEKLLKISEYDT